MNYIYTIRWMGAVLGVYRNKDAAYSAAYEFRRKGYLSAYVERSPEGGAT